MKTKTSFEFETPKLETSELDNLSWAEACKKYNSYIHKLNKEDLPYNLDAYKEALNYRTSEYNRLFDYLQKRREERNEYTKLELEYKKLSEEVKPQIEEKIEQASKLIREATALADKHGVPFYSDVSDISQWYYPRSGEKFAEIDDVLGEYKEFEHGPEYGWYGWEHSAVC